MKCWKFENAEISDILTKSPFVLGFSHKNIAALMVLNKVTKQLKDTFLFFGCPTSMFYETKDYRSNF